MNSLRSLEEMIAHQKTLLNSLEEKKLSKTNEMSSFINGNHSKAYRIWKYALKEMKSNYGFAHSIDCYLHIDRSILFNYDYILKTDHDIFLTPKIFEYIYDYHHHFLRVKGRNVKMVAGEGGYNLMDTTRRNITGIAKSLGIKLSLFSGLFSMRL